MHSLQAPEEVRTEHRTGVAGPPPLPHRATQDEAQAPMPLHAPPLITT